MAHPQPFARPDPRPDPLPLFDPAAGEHPPRDAVELYFAPPITASMYYLVAIGGDGGSISNGPGIAEAIQQAREEAMARALKSLYDHALLKVGYHTKLPHSRATVGEYLPGQLFVTRVAHDWAINAHGLRFTDVTHLHDHVYLGATGTLRGQRWPVDLLSCRRGCTSMQPIYESAFQRSLTESLDVRWSFRNGGDPASELVHPPLIDYVAKYPRRIAATGTTWPSAGTSSRSRGRRGSIRTAADRAQ